MRFVIAGCWSCCCCLCLGNGLLLIMTSPLSRHALQIGAGCECYEYQGKHYKGQTIEQYVVKGDGLELFKAFGGDE